MVGILSTRIEKLKLSFSISLIFFEKTHWHLDRYITYVSKTVHLFQNVKVTDSSYMTN